VRHGITPEDNKAIMGRIIEAYQSVESARVRITSFDDVKRNLNIKQIENMQTQLAHVMGCATHLSNLLADIAGDIHHEDYAFQNLPVWYATINTVVTIPVGEYGQDRYNTIISTMTTGDVLMHRGTQVECMDMHDKCMEHLKQNFHRVKLSNGCAVYMRKASAE
jgi:hypothetical protein